MDLTPSLHAVPISPIHLPLASGVVVDVADISLVSSGLPEYADYRPFGLVAGIRHYPPSGLQTYGCVERGRLIYYKKWNTDAAIPP